MRDLTVRQIRPERLTSRPWPLVLAVALLLLGCRGRGTLEGRGVSLDSDEVRSMTELIEKAIGLIDDGKGREVLRLTKKDLPKAGQATVVATLKKVAAADTWEIGKVQRFGESYLRAAVNLGGQPPASVTINFLEQDERLVFTGGG